MNGLLDTAKILAAALKLAESHTKKEIQKLREDLDLHSDELRENLIEKLRDELEIQSAELRQKYNSLHLIEGDIGPIGPRGDRGFMGATGDRGSQGIQGEQGLSGDKGEKGDQGLQGLKGDQGQKGYDGSHGLKGDQGDQGERGYTGEKGDSGLDGRDGPSGRDGKNGLDGADGKDGASGADGLDGIDGLNGIDGLAGKEGLRGKTGLDGGKGDKGDKGDPGSDANIAPLEKKFEQLTNTVETKISRIAYSAATGRSPGSGEVNLKYLDDIDINSVNSATNGQVLVYNSTLKKWQANTSSGGNSSANAFTQTITTRSIIPEANNLYDLGSYSKRFKDLWLSGNTIQLGTTLIKSDPSGGISTALAAVPGSNTANVVFITLGAGRTNIDGGSSTSTYTLPSQSFDCGGA